MSTVTMDQLMANLSSAKKKMVLGIVFEALFVFFVFLGYVMIFAGTAYGFSAFLLIMSLAFAGVGTPFLIIGIINTIKANRKISLAKAGRPAAPVAQAPVVQAPVVQAPVVQAPVVQAAPAPQPVAPVAPQPVAPVAPVAQPAPQPAAPTYAAPQKPAGFVDIDWRKYEPLDAGVSYNPNKDYKFHRAEGFVGSVPQTFVNRTFPKCPICCSADPQWTIAQHNQMSWKGNLYLFKCECCGGIISMSMPDVTTLGNGGSGIVSNPTVGLTNLMVKSSSGKQVGAVYAVIESVGKSGVTAECEGKEFKLEQMQDMFLRM